MRNLFVELYIDDSYKSDTNGYYCYFFYPDAFSYFEIASVVLWLSCSPRVRLIVGSWPRSGPTKAYKVVCVASPLSTQH